MPDPPAHYRLLEHLGTGTLGELHRARDLQRGRTVALRLVDPRIAQDPAALDALLSAAQAAARLSHPSVAAIFESGVEDGRAFVATEFVPGDRLSAIVRAGRLHPARALEIAVHVADALSELHAIGQTFGTLSADSIVVTPRGGAKLLDCGLSMWTRAGSEPSRDDVVGLGEVLFEMLAGRPRRAGWPGELRIAEVPSEIAPLIDGMTGSAGGPRFESMPSAAAALREVAGSFEQRRNDGAAHVRRPVGSPANRRGVAAAAIVAAAALAGIGWWLLAF